MNEFKFTFDQTYDYFAYRLPMERLAKRDALNVRCPFHEDKNPSMSLNLAKGVWNCHSCGKSGGMLDFERAMMGTDTETAWSEIYRITGMEPPKHDRKLVKIYDYMDVAGKVIYQKLRYEPKQFSQRQPDGKNGWWYNLNGVKKVLYRLPEVISAKMVFVCYAPDTEVLTPEGWLVFPELTLGHTIAQYDDKTESIEWVRPEAVQKFDFNGDLLNFHSRWSDLAVTPDHRMLVRKLKKDRSLGTPEVVSANAVRSHWKLPTSGFLARGVQDVPTEAEARLLVSIQADGIYPRGYQLNWNLKRERKKERLRILLSDCGIPWHEMSFDSTPGWTLFIVENRQNLAMLRFLAEKRFTWAMLNWPVSVRLAVLDELRYWDGDSDGAKGAKGLRYFTSEQPNAEIISACCAVTGYSCVMTRRDRHRENSKPEYILNLQPTRWRQCMGERGWAYKAQPYAGKVYCCTVPSGFIVVRRNGKSMVCGQCEGEKDADNLTDAFAAAGLKNAAVTTTFDGAGKWKQEYAPYFTGRLVVVLADNDAIGKAHQQTICASVKPFAAKVKAVELAGLPEKGDVSDWLASGHTVKELLALIKATPLWAPEKTEHVLLEEMRDFLDKSPAEIEWLVNDLIPVGTRGLMVADPKVGKSPLALDLALALASGSSWLGHVVPRRRRVAIISREDSPRETGRRLKLFAAGTAARGEYNWGQIWLNTIDQSPMLHVDNAEQLNALIKELQMEQFDLAIFDVFSELHTGDENDNTVMTSALDALTRIQTEAHCGVLLLHHLSKAQSGNVFRDARGAGAIHGWTEWGVGLTVVDETVARKQWVRKVEFELKYACPADPVHFMIVGDDESMRIELTDAPETPAIQRRGKVKEIFSYDGRQRATGEN